MIVLIVGAVGGAGTTTLATTLLRQGVPAMGLDLADGMLAARMERRVYPLEQAVFSRGDRLVEIDRIVKNRPALVWTPGCATDPERVWSFVNDLAKRIPIIADGGVEPPAGIWGLTNYAFAVSRKDDFVAAWHEQRLRQVYPELHVVTGALQAAGNAIAEQVFAEQLSQRQAPGGQPRILKWLRSQ